MSKLERRRIVVTLYQGEYEQKIEAAAREVMEAAAAVDAAVDTEKRQGPRRQGQTLPSTELRTLAMEAAKRHDDMVAEADEAGAVKVNVWALAFDESFDLADLHPPRTDVDDEGEPKFPGDAQNNVNMKTYLRPLTCASLVEPGLHEGVAKMVDAGKKVLADLSPSRIQYLKLETAAWNVNAGDVELPKVSLVSLLTAANESESEQPSEQE